MLACTCGDKTGTLDTETEFVCHLPGPKGKDYSFYPLYDQKLYKIDADTVIYVNDDQFRVLRSSSDESSKWEEKLEAPEYREQKRSKAALMGGWLYIGVTTGLPLEEIDSLQLYLGPEWNLANMLNWLEWRVSADTGWLEPFKPGVYHPQLEIFKHLDIRELEVDTAFQSRLYSSDFLTSGKLLWHFKHYLAPAKCFALLPQSQLEDAARVNAPTELVKEFGYVDFAGLSTPRLWLKVKLPSDERVSDLRRFAYFDSNTVPVINRRRNYRNKYTMGQSALEVNLFELTDDDEEHAPERLFSIDRVWDSNDDEYSNFLDLDAYGNPRKYLILEETESIRVNFDFTTVPGEPPDYVVVEFSESEGSGGNGIGADIEFATAQAHPQIQTVRNLITSRGGSDAKTADEIKRLTGFFLRNHGVAVSEGEIEYLAKHFDTRIDRVEARRGVSRTNGGLLPAVTVDVSLKADTEIDDDERTYLLERLSDYLDSYTPINLHLEARWREGK
jgi:hypothetical protein